MREIISNKEWCCLPQKFSLNERDARSAIQPSTDGQWEGSNWLNRIKSPAWYFHRCQFRNWTRGWIDQLFPPRWTSIRSLSLNGVFSLVRKIRERALRKFRFDGRVMSGNAAKMYCVSLRRPCSRQLIAQWHSHAWRSIAMRVRNRDVNLLESERRTENKRKMDKERNGAGGKRKKKKDY